MITVLDRGYPRSFTFDDMLAYHGPDAPGGVAHAVKVMERTFPPLSPEAPLERRELAVRASFGGRGLRDAFELVTRAVTENRYSADAAHGTAFEDLGHRRGYVFRLGYRDRSVICVLRDGIVREEFLTLARKEAGARTRDEQIHLNWLKEEMASRIMKLHATAVYDVVD
ncbi:MAG: hypothetical protein AAF566_10360 [Pseudomonadota bacterium]